MFKLFKEGKEPSNKAQETENKGTENKGTTEIEMSEEDKKIQEEVRRMVTEEVRRGEKEKKEQEEIHKRHQLECGVGWPQATAEDYAAWLKGYILQGGKISNFYDYDILDDLIIAIGDANTIQPLYGAESKSVIVPKGKKFEVKEGELGHNEIYFMDGFRQMGGIVPLYNDVKDILLRVKAGTETKEK